MRQLALAFIPMRWYISALSLIHNIKFWTTLHLLFTDINLLYYNLFLLRAFWVSLECLCVPPVSYQEIFWIFIFPVYLET